MGAIVLIVIIICMIFAVAFKAKTWKSWMDDHTSEREKDENA